ncbi:MAG: hypothetical protein IT561_08635 [Alphaproteobacteria bacterium]|nr:hypothetical protein [Alphaproteobacteria bacterium]
MIRRTAAALAVLVFASAGAAADLGPFGTPTVPYTADSTVSADGRNIAAKVYADGARERRETTVEGRTQILLVDRDQQKATVLLPEQKTAMEVDVRNAGAGRAGDIKWTTRELGPEALGPVAAVKHAVEGANGRGDRIAGIVWITAERIPVKAELDVTADGRTRHVSQLLSNLKVGPVDPALLTVPADYRRVVPPAGTPPGKG